MIVSTIKRSAPKPTLGSPFIFSVLIIVMLMVCCTSTLVLAEEQTDTPIKQGRGENEIVLIHGLGSNNEIWRHFAPYLMGSYKVWEFELPGHGSTKPIVNPDIVSVSELLNQFMRDNDIAYPTLVGHGVGGLIALRFTIDHPADVYRLIMIDIAAKQLATIEQKSSLVDGLLRDYDYTIASHYIDISPDSSIVHEVIDQALRTDSTSFISLLTSTLDFDYSSELADHSVPLLVIGSESLFPDQQTIRQRLRVLGFAKVWNLNFKRIEGSGHFVMLERPVVLAQTVLTFIKSEQPR